MMSSRIDRSIAFAFTVVLVAAAGCYIAVDKTGGSSCPANATCGVDPNGLPTVGTAGTNGSGYPGGPLPPCGGSLVLVGIDCALPDGGAGGDAGGQATGPRAPLPRAPAAPASCPAVGVSRFKSLMIIDPGVTGDSRADDRSPYHPWSFRQRLEDLVPGNPDGAASLAAAWLAQWSSSTDVPASVTPGADRIPIEPRPAASTVLTCPWLVQSPDNGCDSACESCRARHVDLARSPFRLLAIANRSDVAGAAACGGAGGELRFVYGAADPTTLRALPFTVIFEYTVTLAQGETLRDWAAAWRDLDVRFPAPGTSEYNAALDVVVGKGLARATLRRVLTNEVAFGTADGLPWEMRQFVPALTDAGTVRLLEVAMTATPRLTLASSPDLGKWIDDNAAAVLAGDNPLPATMLAASAPIPTPDFAWHTAAHDPATATAFNRNTCNGCHGGRTDSTDLPFQHVSPPTTMGYYGAGGGSPVTARLSRFLNNPGHDDELARRERQLAATLCTVCSAGPDGGAPY